MMKQILLSAVLACISVFSAAAQKEPVDYVNPFVGTTNSGQPTPLRLTCAKPVRYLLLNSYGVDHHCLSLSLSPSGTPITLKGVTDIIP